MKFYIVASGSKGNATLLEHDGRVLLIDMGIAMSRLSEELRNLSHCVEDIEAVLFTHEHSDHASGAGFFPDDKIYCTEGTLGGRMNRCLIPYRTINLIGLDITPLPTSHDAFLPVGFIFQNADEKLVYMTDTGFIDEKNIAAMKNADYYIIEANHNVKMLLRTNRPPELKQRILSDVGHLSNEDSAMYMSEVVGERTKEIVLAHLSEEANSDEAALEAYKRIFRKRFIDINKIKLHCANQWKMTRGGKSDED